MKGGQMELTNEQIIGLLPELQEIQDLGLRKLSIEALKLAAAQGGWDETTILLAPVTVNWKGCSSNLLEHIRTVTQVCMDNYERLSHYYNKNGTGLDRDTVICGALLHDLGKFTEFALKDGSVVHSENAYLMRHPLAGAILAAQAGLPETIVHLIATHSFEGDRSNQTPESAFVRAIDDFVFKCTVYGLDK